MRTPSLSSCALAGMALLVLPLSLGCGKKATTQVIVELNAEPGVLAQAATLRVVMDNEEGEVVLDREKPLDSTMTKLARIPVIPQGGDATRRFRLRASVLDAGGNEVSKLEARAGYIEDKLTELELWFHDACTGKADCSEGRTCHHGVCLGSCYTPGTGGPARPECGECQVCGDTCVAQSNLPCGCDGDRCDGSGACIPRDQVAKVGAGLSHTCASLDSNPTTTFCWGSTTLSGGNKGRLGTGAAGDDSPAPVLIPGIAAREGIAADQDQTCAISFGRRTCFGSNDHNQLGGDVGTVVPTPVEISEPYSFNPIASGIFHMCAVDKSQKIYCWGDNSRGSIGTGATSTPVALPTEVVVPGSSVGFKSVSAGGYHSCGLAHTGQIYCWGLNQSYELGATTPVPAEGKTPYSAIPLRAGCEQGLNTLESCFDDYVQVAAGAFHTCGIRASGEMYCFGGNKNGQLGLGWSDTNESEPNRVSGNRTWSEVDGGNSYTCGLTTGEKKQLLCWGLNTSGELGIPDVGSLDTPTQVPVDAPAGWFALALGRYHGCAIRNDRTLWCWGLNKDGQVGAGRATQDPLPPTRVCFPSVASP